MSSGADLVRLLATRVGEAYRLGVRVDLRDPEFHGRPHGSPVPADATRDKAWDCAELGSWGVLHAHGVLLGVAVPHPRVPDPYTGFWAADVDAGRVTRIPLELAYRTPGSLLLRRPAAAGASGHLAVSNGKGGSYEAHSTARGVVLERATGRRWDDAFTIPGVEYELGPELPVVPVPTVLRVGSRGDAVKRLQVALAATGLPSCRRLVADGVYGVKTAGAVTEYQIDRGLVPDGEAGPQTLGALGLA